MPAILLSLAAVSLADGPGFPPGHSTHAAAADGLAFSLYLPEDLGEAKPPLLVALHETGFTDQDWAKLLTSLADEGKVALLCPRASGLGFGPADQARLLKTVEAVGERLEAGSVHLLGMRDSGWQALLLALARPRSFHTVISLGADVPPVRPASGASALRLLVMKAGDDRPAIAREAVGVLREHLEVADFRIFLGDPRSPDPASRQYMLHFLNAAAGRVKAGEDRSLPWLPAGRGLAERARLKCRALVYFFDVSPVARSRTEKIQNQLLFDEKVRAAIKKSGIVPILADRREAEKLLPTAKLIPGPALVVLDEEGKAVGALQKNLGATGLIALLSAR